MMIPPIAINAAGGMCAVFSGTFGLSSLGGIALAILAGALLGIGTAIAEENGPW